MFLDRSDSDTNVVIGLAVAVAILVLISTILCVLFARKGKIPVVFKLKNRLGIIELNMLFIMIIVSLFFSHFEGFINKRENDSSTAHYSKPIHFRCYMKKTCLLLLTLTAFITCISVILKIYIF